MNGQEERAGVVVGQGGGPGRDQGVGAAVGRGVELGRQDSSAVTSLAVVSLANADSELAAWVRAWPMAWTSPAAEAGSSMTHHTAKATSAHKAMRFTGSSRCS